MAKKSANLYIHSNKLGFNEIFDLKDISKSHAQIIEVEISKFLDEYVSSAQQLE